MTSENINIMHINIMPPVPPSYEEERFKPGEFLYVKEINSREMLRNAYSAISLTESWDFAKKDIDSFMFSNDPRIDIISNKMCELGYTGHSGSSFGWTMRQMQYIAQNGENIYREEILLNED